MRRTIVVLRRVCAPGFDLLLCPTKTCYSGDCRCTFRLPLLGHQYAFPSVLYVPCDQKHPPLNPEWPAVVPPTTQSSCPSRALVLNMSSSCLSTHTFLASQAPSES